MLNSKYSIIKHAKIYFMSITKRKYIKKISAKN